MIDDIRKEIKKIEINIDIYCGKIDQINAAIGGY